MKSIYLIGFMGTGKSTVAYELRKKTAAILVEMDQVIEEQQKKTIPEIFDEFGEEYFRDIETDLLLSFEQEDNLIVSCGGGSVLRDANTASMKKHGKIVWLTATPETVYERVKNSTNRPVLNGNMNVEYIRELMEKRRARYEEVADITVSTDEKSVQDICTEILKQL